MRMQLLLAGCLCGHLFWFKGPKKKKKGLKYLKSSIIYLLIKLRVRAQQKSFLNISPDFSLLWIVPFHRHHLIFASKPQCKVSPNCHSRVWQAPPVNLTLSTTGTRCNFKHTETLTQFPDAHVAEEVKDRLQADRPTDRPTDGRMDGVCVLLMMRQLLCEPQFLPAAEILLTVCMCREMKPRWEAVTFPVWSSGDQRSKREKIKYRWEFIWCSPGSLSIL